MAAQLDVEKDKNRYNGEGQRIRKEETKGTESSARNYYYQDGKVLYTTDGANQRDSFNLLGREDNVIATARGTGSSEAWYLYNKDVRGSTSSLIDDSGTVAAAYEYDEFGNTMIRAGEDFDNELCYTGQVYDKETGLYYYNARFHDPEDGRFLAQDTYRGENMEPDTLHLYAYCANNPVNYVDPSGHSSVPTWHKKTITYKVRGKGTLKVKFEWWKSKKRKQVIVYKDAKVSKKSAFLRITKIFRNETKPQSKYMNVVNIQAALAIWKWQITGVSSGMYPWSVMILDINIRGNKKPMVKYRKKSVSYKKYKKWKWGDFN